MPNTSEMSVQRYAWGAAGFAFFALGAAGVVLPGVPTTGPMIAALGCFSRSSPRLRRWLLGHPRFGPALRRWQHERTIPRKAKLLALAMMSASAVYLSVLAPLPVWGLAAALAFIATGAIYVGRLPTSVPRAS